MIMRLEHTDIVNVISDLGTATTADIIAVVKARWPDQDRDDNHIRRMLPGLIRYRFIDYVERWGKRYYFIYGTDPNPAVDAGRVMARVTDFLTANAPQGYTSEQIADNIGTSANYARRILARAPNVTHARIIVNGRSAKLYRAVV